MSEETYSLQQLVNADSRYPIAAYQFVREALAFAADSMELGNTGTEPAVLEKSRGQNRRERHLTGQQLCEAIRLYAIKQYGLMAKIVLNRWGILRTGDFGDIVYNMIEVGIMKKSSRDERGHFDDVYCFQEAFEDAFEICPSNTPRSC